jgi:hypothetical protein
MMIRFCPVLLTFPNADPGGWSLDWLGCSLSYRAAAKYRYGHHPFVFGWWTGFFAFGEWSKWGSAGREEESK